MNDVMAELAKEHKHTMFVKLEAEAVPEVSEKYEIASVPTFLFFKEERGWKISPLLEWSRPKRDAERGKNWAINAACLVEFAQS
ncbi:hypothetical protein DNTS_030571 [Danionella cerebrum]|uniref:Thioredoxin domain-containing protein n=1 Tax=Danionella cerebrum TaxID=2873325 RepID=A0A553RAF6_9TELE|nr:hypothetical protein DNTS_030571 [Danionella translucida]